MDDFVLNVRQIAQYQTQTSVGPNDYFLFQSDGLGGPYLSISAPDLVGSALRDGFNLNIGPGSGVSWNGALLTWLNGQFIFNQPVAAPELFVGDVPVATAVDIQAILANSVYSFNGRTGVVQLEEPDILRAGGLPQNNPHLHGWATSDTPLDRTTALPDTQLNDDSIVTARWVQFYLGNILQNCAVASFNGRTGNVTLTTQDVNDAYAVPGPPWPTAPNPAFGDASNRIATTLFVDDSMADLEQRILAEVAPPIDISLYAPLNSPAFSGIPSAPTANVGTSTGQLATTAFVHNAVTAATTGVASFNTRTGAVVLTLADVTGAGGAPLAGPIFTGTPQAPTVAPGDSSTKLATTAFVAAAIAAIPTAGVASFNTRTGAVVLNTADITGAGGAVLASPALTGTPTAPTATAGTNTTQLATTAFVAAAVAGSTAGVSSFNGRTGSVSLIGNDVSSAGGALVASPNLTGIPTAPTANPGTGTQQIATCAFVAAAISGATAGVASWNSRTGAVTMTVADITGAGGAPSASPALTGTPTAPTPAQSSNDTTLATTAYVRAALAAAPGGVSSWNSRTGAVTLQAADVSAVGGALTASPNFTGTPTAPTVANADSSTTLATTAFVHALLAAAGGVTSFNSRAGTVTLTEADIRSTSFYAQADTAPALTSGTMWFDSVRGQLYVRYTDPISSANNWVIANSPPTPPPASGSRVQLAKTVISASTAAVSFFQGFDGTYDELEFHIFDVQASTTTLGSLFAQFSTDGSTFDAGTNYSYQYVYSILSSPTSAAAAGQAAATAVLFAFNVPDSADPTWPYYLIIRVRPALTPTALPRCVLAYQSSCFITNYGNAAGGATYTAALPTKGIKFGIQSNNIIRGTFIAFGIAK